MSDNELRRAVDGINRIGMVLGALLAAHLGDLDQKVKAERLSQCGYTNTEIADLLGTTPNTINVALHAMRRRKKPTRARARRQ
ncbi:MAG: hypothetical protein AMXMBFR83_05900 [Phycisphaerae bacterium]|jgi:DNA-binding NarL/FixJ family response regulator